MRLKKKPLQRTAAAALALSMAVSVAAAPATAAYRCDISKGDVNISVNDKGEKTITVNGEAVENDGDDEDIIIYDGSNSSTEEQSSAADEVSENAAESSEDAISQEPAAETDESAEADNTAEDSEDAAAPDSEAAAEAPAEDSSEAEADEDQPAEPATMELEAPAEEDSQPESGNTVTTDADGNTVIEQADTDAEPEKEAVLPETAAEADADEDEVTYSSEAETKVGNNFVDNVIKIVNNCKDTLKVTLENVKINASQKNSAAVSAEGNVEIELSGDNELVGGDYHSGLESNKKKDTDKLTVSAKDKDASLKATGGTSSAGIGGKYEYGSNVTIKGGNITAIGGAGTYGGAGIGAGGDSFNEVTDITIDGGHITAIGGGGSSGGGAGIGGGSSNSGAKSTTITINDGTIEATGGTHSAGIGGASSGKNTTVTINGGDITATAGMYGAGIGSGQWGSNTTIEISGKDTKVTSHGGAGSGGGAGIGSGAKNSGTTKITIKDGTIVADSPSANEKQSTGGAGIGGGDKGSSSSKVSVDITIEGGNITATGAQNAAGIGGGRRQGSTSPTVVRILGGVIKAFGGDMAAGIGSSVEGKGSTTVNISSGNVTAVGGKNGGAGIGSGQADSGTTEINITGGTIDATGNIKGDTEDGAAAAIGSGANATGTATITINGRDGAATITATRTGYANIDNKVADAIGNGSLTVDDLGEDNPVIVTLKYQKIDNGDGDNSLTTYKVLHNTKYVEEKLTNNLISDTDPQKKAHQWEVVSSIEPTCTENGSVEYKCGVDGCGATYHVDLPAIGHDWGKWTIVKAPTTSEEGEEQRVCKNDASHVESRSIAKLPEESSDPVPDTELPAQNSSTEAAAPKLEVLNILNNDVINDMTKVEQTYDSVSRVLSIRADLSVATLTGTLEMLDGVDTVVFTTRLSTSTLDLNELRARFGSDAAFRLLHTGPVTVLLVNGLPRNGLLK